MGHTMLVATGLALTLAGQITNQTLTNQTPSDARSNQFEDPKGTSWKTFAVDSYPAGPLAVVEVAEVRQQNPPSTWAVFVRNDSLLPVTSYRMAAAVVDVNGKVKAVQPMPAIKNLKPTKVARQEVRIIATVLMPTDRVVFFVNEVTAEEQSWKAVQTEVAELITAAALKLPVP